MVGQIIIQIAGAFLAVISFALILEVPRTYILYAGLVGALGWLVYLLIDLAAGSVTMAAFVSSLGVALISHIFARKFKAPVTVFLVAGILPSVPGASIYKSVYYVISDASSVANFYLVETLQIAGAIAMAIFIMDSIFRLIQKRQG